MQAAFTRFILHLLQHSPRQRTPVLSERCLQNVKMHPAKCAPSNHSRDSLATIKLYQFSSKKSYVFSILSTKKWLKACIYQPILPVFILFYLMIAVVILHTAPSFHNCQQRCIQSPLPRTPHLCTSPQTLCHHYNMAPSIYQARSLWCR